MKSCSQCFGFGHHFVVMKKKGHVNGRGINIIGGLTHIEVVMWFDGMIVAFFLAAQLKSYIGKHFVSVHVGRSTGATLVHVDEKMLMILSVDNSLAGFFNGGQFFFTHSSDIRVSTCSRQLDHGISSYIIRIKFGRYAANLEIFKSAGRLDAIICFGRNLLIT